MSFGTAIIVPGVTGATGQSPIDMDALDKAATPVPGLLAFLRAKKFASTTAANALSWKDRLLNSVAAVGTTRTFTLSDVTMGNKPTITLTGSGESYGMAAVPMSASFTYVCMVQTGAALKNSDNLMTTSDQATGFQLTATAAGTLTADADGSTSGDNAHTFAGVTLAPSTNYLIAISHDATTKITRLWVNSLSPVAQVTHVIAHAPAAGSFLNPFTYYGSTGAFGWAGKWSMAAFFNVAYGAGGANDPLFTAFMTAAKSFYGV